MLDKLPREIWSCILQYHCSVGTLWACGNRALHLRLSSAVESVTLIHIPVGEFVIPSWVMELSNLKHFELRSLGNCASGQRRWSAMSKLLPNTLESLTIDAQDSCTSFAQWITTVDDLSPDCYPLTSAFPKLTSLALKNANIKTSSDFLLFLPSTLTSLNVGSSLQGPLSFSKLPRSLTYLAARPFIGHPPKWNDLTKVHADLDDIAQVPPGMVLTQLTLRTTALTDETVPLLTKLPSNLLDLTIDRYLPSMVPLLPRSLVKLDLGTQGLMSLAPNVGGGSTASLSMAWPSTLQELTVTFTSCAQGVLASLPPALLRLSLFFRTDGIGNLILFHSNELPPHLQELTLSLPNSHILRFDGQLPPRLTHLKVSDSIMDASNLSASLPDSIECLTLSHLTYGPRSLNASGAFPTNLRTISVSRWRSEWMAELPPQVTNLQIVLLLTDAIKFDLFSSLPRGLVSFKSSDLKSNVSRVISFTTGQLPSLLHLRLPMDLKITSSSIKCLPRTLKTLVVNVNVRTKGAKFLVDLPPHLEVCQVFPPNYTSNDIEEYWPPALWRCLLADKGHWPKISRVRERLLAFEPTSSGWFTSIVDSIFK